MNRRAFLNQLAAGAVMAGAFSWKWNGNLLAQEPIPPSAAGMSTPTEAGQAGQSVVPTSDELVVPENTEGWVTCRTITKGPKDHWGAYYDQMHFDPTDRWVVGNEVDFRGRSPLPEDEIHVGLIDTQDGDRWCEIGRTRAWNWQQGPMFQWIPGRTTYEDAEVIWNDRDDQEKCFFAHVYKPSTGQYRTLPHAVYVLSPDGRYALFPDFARLNDTRPGYGYAGLPDPNRDVLTPKDAGLWRMDVLTGETKLLFSFADIADLDAPKDGYSRNAKHWFNHVLVAPDSRRFLFLHRWRGETEGGSWKTRLITANIDGTDPFVLNPTGMTSHLVWQDPTHVIAFARQPSHGDRFYVFTDRTRESHVVGNDIMKVDGHVSYLPHTGQKWILNDTYPNRQRMQKVFLFEMATEREVVLREFFLPKEFKGEWRVDLHPRASHSGRKILVDIVEGGKRQIAMLELGKS